MDKLKETLTNLYYKIDKMYYELTDLDCDLFVTVQMEEQIKDVLSLYDQFKQELSNLYNIDWNNKSRNTVDEPVTLLEHIIDAWTLVQTIDKQIFNGTIKVETLKEFDNVMGKIRLVSVGLLV